MVLEKNNRDIDILFVIDNSGSMQEEQFVLAAGFDKFVAALESSPVGMPNVHIGVVSTDVGANDELVGCPGNGDNGVLQNTRGAGAPLGCEPPQGMYIEDIEQNGVRVRNYSGTLADTLSCIAQLGTSGCGFEQPLEAMYRALAGGKQENAGFLREDAYLAVVFVGDEDDCSAADRAVFAMNDTSLGPLSSFRCFEYGVVCADDSDPRAPGSRTDCRPRDDSPYMYPIGRYVDFLKNLKREPGKVMVAGIIGDSAPVVVGVDVQGRPTLAPSCISENGEAAPGIRLQAVFDQFPWHNAVSTICSNSLTDALLGSADLFTRAMGVTCIPDTVLDTDPAVPGIQPLCEVRETFVSNTGQEQVVSIPSCDASGGVAPCWRVENRACSEILVERGGIAPPEGAVTRALCQSTLCN